MESVFKIHPLSDSSANITIEIPIKTAVQPRKMYQDTTLLRRLFVTRNFLSHPQIYMRDVLVYSDIISLEESGVKHFNTASNRIKYRFN